MKSLVPICLFCLSACGGGLSPREVAPPPSISVDQAFRDVGQGILEFRKMLADSKTTIGMVVCKIDVNFNISAQAVSGTKAGIDVSVPLEAAKLGANASRENNSTGNRGNTVQVQLGSVYPEFCGLPQGAAPVLPATAAAPARPVGGAPAAPQAGPPTAPSTAPSAVAPPTPQTSNDVQDRLNKARRDAFGSGSAAFQLQPGAALLK